MGISSAYAQAAGGAPGGFDLISLMPLVLIFVVFYFLLIRPQQKKMKAHREMLGAIRRGDKVVTGGRHRRDRSSRSSEDDQVTLVEIADEVRVQGCPRPPSLRVADQAGTRLAPRMPRPKAPAGGGAEAGAKSGLMSQLFGKK